MKSSQSRKVLAPLIFKIAEYLYVHYLADLDEYYYFEISVRPYLFNRFVIEVRWTQEGKRFDYSRMFDDTYSKSYVQSCADDIFRQIQCYLEQPIDKITKAP